MSDNSTISKDKFVSLTYTITDASGETLERIDLPIQYIHGRDSQVIENIGKVKGSEVVQLYIEDINASVDRPRKELKDFLKVELGIGEIKEVSFKINRKMLSFYDVDSKRWKAEPGKFKLHVGSASDDVRLTAEFELVDAEHVN